MKTIIIAAILLTCISLQAEEKQLTQEQKVIAMTILGEARGEGKAGMYAVACVIAQRSIEWKRNGKN